MSPSAHNLPVQLTPFVDRTQELAEIVDLLANPDCRLLTLVGLGGTREPLPQYVGQERVRLDLVRTAFDHELMRIGINT